MKMSEAYPGMHVRLTSKDTDECLPTGTVRVVMQRPNGLAVRCGEGWHYLDAHLSDDGSGDLIGVEKYDG